MNPLWRGNQSHSLADAHASEAQHRVWKDGQIRQKADPRPDKSAERAKAKSAVEFTSAVSPVILPSARLSKRNMCDGKATHHTAACAQRAIDNSDYDREFLNVYQCLYCGKYHVGHVIKPWLDSKLPHRNENRKPVSEQQVIDCECGRTFIGQNAYRQHCKRWGRKGHKVIGKKSAV
jgi:hypothetical protein